MISIINHLRVRGVNIRKPIKLNVAEMMSWRIQHPAQLTSGMSPCTGGGQNKSLFPVLFPANVHKSNAPLQDLSLELG